MRRLSLVLFLIIVSSCNQGRSPLKTDATFRELDLVQANFESISQKIIGPKCLLCHTGPQSPHGIDLSGYRAIVQNSLFPPLVVPFKPEESSFYLSVKSGEMPRKFGGLSETELEAIYNWILNGATFNGEAAPTPIATEPPD